MSRFCAHFACSAKQFRFFAPIFLLKISALGSAKAVRGIAEGGASDNVLRAGQDRPMEANGRTVPTAGAGTRLKIVPGKIPGTLGRTWQESAALADAVKAHKWLIPKQSQTTAVISINGSITPSKQRVAGSSPAAPTRTFFLPCLSSTSEYIERSRSPEALRDRVH